MAHEILPSRATPASGQSSADGGRGEPPGESPADSPADSPVGAREGAALSARPVSLTRLLSVAVLTPAQAVLVAEQLLHAAATQDAAAATPPPGSTAGAVTVTASGAVQVSARLGGFTPALAELLEQIVQNARRLPAHPRPEQLKLLRTLEDVVRDPLPGPESRARELEAALLDIAGPNARDRIPAQLAALVRAFAHVPGQVTADPFASRGPAVPAPARAVAALPATPPPPGHDRHPPRRARHVPTGPSPRGRAVPLRGRSRTRRTGLVALVLVAALTATGYVFLRGPGAALVESLGPDGEPDAPATAAPAPSPPAKERASRPQPPRRQAVPALADRRAGPVTAVALQKVSGCRAGEACQVKVTVRFRPSSSAQPIAWKVGAARLCERGVAWSPTTTVTAQPGWTTVYAHSTVRLPQDRSRALVALTTTPARAQSRPVPLTGSSLRC